jgi:hypothetical protein
MLLAHVVITLVVICVHMLFLWIALRPPQLTPAERRLNARFIFLHCLVWEGLCNGVLASWESRRVISIVAGALLVTLFLYWSHEIRRIRGNANNVDDDA